MHLNLITPDRRVYEGEVDRVTVPGVKGSFSVLENHAAIVSALAQGYVDILQAADGEVIFDSESGKIRRGHDRDKEFSFHIDGGVIEVLNNKVTILAEKLIED